MTTKARKNNSNLRLKVAILGRFRSQRRFARVVGIGEIRISEIICHRGKAVTDDEQARIARKLGLSVSALFDGAAA